MPTQKQGWNAIRENTSSFSKQSKFRLIQDDILKILHSDTVTGAINTGSYPIVFNTIHGNNLGCISVKGTIQVLNRRSIIVYVSNETYVCILCCWGASWFWNWRDLPGPQAPENSHHASPSADNITHVPVFYMAVSRSPKVGLPISEKLRVRKSDSESAKLGVRMSDSKSI